MRRGEPSTSRLSPVLRVTAMLALLIVVVGTILVWKHYRDDLRAGTERIRGQARMAATACGPIEYASAGDGPPVLVLHGAGGGFDQGLLMAEGLVRAGLRAVAASRPGWPVNR